MKIKNKLVYLSIIVTILLVLLIYILIIRENSKQKLVLERTFDIIMQKYKYEFEKPVLLTYNDFELLTDEELVLNNIDENNFCIKIYNEDGEKKVIIYNSNCEFVSLDLSDANPPLLLNNALRVKNINKNYVVVESDNWYDYDEGEVATIVFIKKNQITSYEIGTIINRNDIERIMIWIPQYYYNTKGKIFSYKNDVGANAESNITNFKNMPYIFFYKNRDLYGYWIDIFVNDNTFNYINFENYNMEIVNINREILESYNIFMEHYGKDQLDMNFNAKALLIGKGKFYEKKY